MLTEMQSWVHSTSVSQTVTIRYNDKLENKAIINGTGKIKLNGKRKLTTPDNTNHTATTKYTLHKHTLARI